MKSYSELMRMRPEAFQRYLGVAPEHYQEMLDYLEPQMPERGRPVALDASQRLTALLLYYRNGSTFFDLAQQFGVSEPTLYRAVVWCEERLEQRAGFRLALESAEETARRMQAAPAVVLVDASETRRQRPQKKPSRVPTGASANRRTRTNRT